MSQDVQRDEFYNESTATGPALGVPVVTAMRVSPTVSERVVTVAAAPTSNVHTAWSRRFAPDAIVAAAAGVVLLLIGLIAITRGGFTGSMKLPVVQVLGFTHTTTLGIIEIIFGGSLLIAGATASRAGARFFGSVLAIGAFVGAVQSKSFRTSLALESAFAWLLVMAGALVVVTSLLLPRYSTRSTTVATDAR